jgi:hypothetical protein
MAKAGFRLGIYVFKDAEIVGYGAPYGVFSVARRFDPELDVFLVAEVLRPVQTQAGLTIVKDDRVQAALGEGVEDRVDRGRGPAVVERERQRGRHRGRRPDRREGEGARDREPAADRLPANRHAVRGLVGERLRRLEHQRAGVRP